MNQLDLEEAKTWLDKRGKMSDAQRDRVPPDGDKIRVVDRVWGQWQIDFANSPGDLPHPFIKELFVAKKRTKYLPETWELIRENLGLKRGRIGQK